ncbi:hypothetical protein HMI56_000549 [Coelomomyces lativittatus]|nr:hypothetical protein HMI56_000549 [Coelomomyces lativittatus]
MTQPNPTQPNPSFFGINFFFPSSLEKFKKRKQQQQQQQPPFQCYLFIYFSFLLGFVCVKRKNPFLGHHFFTISTHTHRRDWILSWISLSFFFFFFFFLQNAM